MIEIVALQHAVVWQVGQRARIVRAEARERAIAGRFGMHDDQVEPACVVDEVGGRTKVAQFGRAVEVDYQPRVLMCDGGRIKLRCDAASARAPGRRQAEAPRAGNGSGKEYISSRNHLEAVPILHLPPAGVGGVALAWAYQSVGL